MPFEIYTFRETISTNNFRKTSVLMEPFPGMDDTAGQKVIFGSSPDIVGGKGTESFSAQGVRPVPGGTESAGPTRIPERLLGFR